MQHPRVLLVGVVVALAALAVPRLALAQIADWKVVEVTPGEPTPKVKSPPPDIKIKVIGEPAPKDSEKDRFRLELDPSDNRRRYKGVAPTKMIPFNQSSDSLAIVLLIEGHPYYLGNTSYVTQVTPGAPPPPGGVVSLVKSAEGVYDVILQSLDADVISGAGNPNSSKGALLVYSSEADVRYPMGPLAQLKGDKLGPQELQKGKTDRQLALGLRASLDQLRRVSATRRVMFVIADGYDAASLNDIKAIRTQADAAQIDIFAFHLEAPTDYIPDDAERKKQNLANMRALGANGGGMYAKVRNGDDLENRIKEAVTAINSSFYLVFPGQVQDPRTKAKAGFDWDGKEHEVRLLRDDEPVTEQNQAVTFMPVWGQPAASSRMWLWVVLGLGGAVVIGGVIALLSRKPPPQPAPMPVAIALPPPEVKQIQPAPAQANKTMAINLSSGDGVPVVGWLVPINGPQQFQTLKLFAGVTKVGNAHGAHIIINDGFMSSEHAHFVMSPQGFTLIDNGSTNGTFVNERRVQRHELIDNDVIKFGKTDCKFKTINTDN